jgi:hypothetical protein
VNLVPILTNGNYIQCQPSVSLKGGSFAGENGSETFELLEFDLNALHKYAKETAMTDFAPANYKPTDGDTVTHNRKGKEEVLRVCDWRKFVETVYDGEYLGTKYGDPVIVVLIFVGRNYQNQKRGLW